MNFNINDFIDNASDREFFNNLSRTSGWRDLDREDSLMASILFFDVANNGHSLSDIENYTPKEKKDIGEGFIDFLERHPIEAGKNVSQEDVRNNLSLYGEIFKKSGEALLNEGVPSLDNLDDVYFTAHLLMDHGQVFEGYEKKAGFYDSIDDMEQLENDVSKLALVAGSLSMIHEASGEGFKKRGSQPKDTEHLKIAADAFVVRQHSDRFKNIEGMSINGAAVEIGRDVKTYDGLFSESQAVINGLSGLNLTAGECMAYYKGGENERITGAAGSISAAAESLSAEISENVQADHYRKGFANQLNKYLVNGENCGNVFFRYLKDEMCIGDDINDLPEADVYDDNYDIVYQSPKGKVKNGEWEKGNKSFYDQLQRIKEHNVLTDDMKKQGLGGLNTMAALVTLHDNPNMYFTDLLDRSGEFKGEKWAAGERVMTAYEHVLPSPRILGKVISDAASAAANINCRKEILHALGADESLEGKAAEDIIMQPENRRKALAVMSAISNFEADADKVLKNAVVGRKKEHIDKPFTEPYETKEVQGRVSKTAVTIDNAPESLETGVAAKVYDAARKNMSPKQQMEYQGITVRRDFQDEILGQFKEYSDQLKNSNSKTSTVAAVEKGLGYIAANDTPVWSFPKGPANVVRQTRMAAEAAEAENALSKGKLAAKNGLTANDRQVIRENEKTVFKKPAVPEKPNLWVRFWGKLGFYKDTLKSYSDATKAYNAQTEKLKNLAETDLKRADAERKASVRVAAAELKTKGTGAFVKMNLNEIITNKENEKGKEKADAKGKGKEEKADVKEKGKEKEEKTDVKEKGKEKKGKGKTVQPRVNLPKTRPLLRDPRATSSELALGGSSGRGHGKR